MQETDIFAEAIAQAESRLTQKEKRISAYFLARPEAILIETNADIARKLDISPMTLTRFYRKLGFNDSADARSKTIQDTYGPDNYRVDQRFETSFSRPQSEDSQVGLELSHASIEAAFSIRDSELWGDVVERVAHSDAVHVTGFQTMYYLADGFSRRLSYLRDRVHLVDGIDGVYAGLLPAPDEKVTLIMMDVFRYGAHGPVLAKLARERGMEVIIFADEFCDWANGITPYVLRYPAETHFFLAMPQGISTGLNLLLQDVSGKLGKRAKQRVQKLAEAQDHFGLFLD
ncbi:Helix-turn-helix domain, rpiR family [Roseovarius albus]|uniref:Helix-turn-helix domain, rpiR family n=1 Tax=Roseovarius albus TaxID=1247867 RepID=A0A1X6Z4H1_9RHOB|nr:MurR/RpiR family transcriptional regulator [Roseovarius albus]SLN38523.1 Helix-turn-helix domain, rpiR family [Roseovarius albus]